MKKSIIILLSVLAITFTFSGCGGSEGSISGAAESDVPSTSTPGETITPPDSVQDNIESSLTSSKERIEASLGYAVPANPGA